jgi:rubrerythrin
MSQALSGPSIALAPRLAERYSGDLAILNVALGLELQAIAAYDAGANSKLLSPDQLKIAVSFQNDHKRHRDALIGWIRRLGGTPVEPKSGYDFGAITSAADIVKLAQKLEEGAEIAYLTNAGNLPNREVLNAAVPILEDEVRHNVVFRQLLGMDVTSRLKY